MATAAKQEVYVTPHKEEEYQKMLETVKPKIDDFLDPHMTKCISERQRRWEESREKELMMIDRDNVNFAERLAGKGTSYPTGEYLKDTSKNLKEADRAQLLKDKQRLDDLKKLENENVQIQKRIESVPANYDKEVLAKDLQHCYKKVEHQHKQSEKIKEIEDKRLEEDNKQIADRIISVAGHYDHVETMKDVERMKQKESHNRTIKEKIREMDMKRRDSDNFMIAKRIIDAKSKFVAILHDKDFEKRVKKEQDFHKKRIIEHKVREDKIVERHNEALNKRILSTKTTYPRQAFHDEYLHMKAKVTKAAKFPDHAVLDEEKRRNREIRKERIQSNKERMEQAEKKRKRSVAVCRRVQESGDNKSLPSIHSKSDKASKASGNTTNNNQITRKGHTIGLTDRSRNNLYANTKFPESFPFSNKLYVLQFTKVKNGKNDKNMQSPEGVVLPPLNTLSFLCSNDFNAECLQSTCDKRLKSKMCGSDIQDIPENSEYNHDSEENSPDCQLPSETLVDRPNSETESMFSEGISPEIEAIAAENSNHDYNNKNSNNLQENVLYPCNVTNNYEVFTDCERVVIDEMINKICLMEEVDAQLIKLNTDMTISDENQLLLRETDNNYNVGLDKKDNSKYVERLESIKSKNNAQLYKIISNTCSGIEGENCNNCSIISDNDSEKKNLKQDVLTIKNLTEIITQQPIIPKTDSTELINFQVDETAINTNVITETAADGIANIVTQNNDCDYNFTGHELGTNVDDKYSWTSINKEGTRNIIQTDIGSENSESHTSIKNANDEEKTFIEDDTVSGDEKILLDNNCCLNTHDVLEANSFWTSINIENKTDKLTKDNNIYAEPAATDNHLDMTIIKDKSENEVTAENYSWTSINQEIDTVTKTGNDTCTNFNIIKEHEKNIVDSANDFITKMSDFGERVKTNYNKILEFDGFLSAINKPLPCDCKVDDTTNVFIKNTSSQQYEENYEKVNNADKVTNSVFNNTVSDNLYEHNEYYFGLNMNNSVSSQKCEKDNTPFSCDNVYNISTCEIETESSPNTTDVASNNRKQKMN